ncbi:hypothetical protein CEXT_4841 [Caerostris extrusa]|uniref:Uncharacterized protein n=1 Tax=Caerostris extrusa TaxID=172846 RepID=A0AAV4N0I2_CAEEX|nr:hypothetical protein CEXT_4841 [Caerostris extrusa]
MSKKGIKNLEDKRKERKVEKEKPQKRQTESSKCKGKNFPKNPKIAPSQKTKYRRIHQAIYNGMLKNEINQSKNTEDIAVGRGR